MLLLSVLVVCLAVTGLSMLIHAAYAAPEGAEDEKGFYLTVPGDSTKQALLQPSLMTPADLVFFKQ